MATVNPNQDQRSLDQCEPASPLLPDVNLDPAPPYCDTAKDPILDAPNNNKRSVNDDSLNWLRDQVRKTGFGARVDCDPAQRGNIVDDPENPERTYLFRYSKSMRGADEAMLDMFSNVKVIDEDGKAWRIPVTLGPPEKAVAAIVQDNVRKDETLVVDRLKLPMLALTQTSIDYDLDRYTYHKAINRFPRKDGKPGTLIQEGDSYTVFGFARGVPINMGYTLTAWTMYHEDMNQIVEQILTKFSHAAYIRVTGVPWEIIVKLDSIANNVEAEPGDQKVRVFKYEFNMTVQTYIPQPIERKKAVTKIKVDFVDGMTEDEITQVMARIEEAVKGLEC